MNTITIANKQWMWNLKGWFQVEVKLVAWAKQLTPINITHQQYKATTSLGISTELQHLAVNDQE